MAAGSAFRAAFALEQVSPSACGPWTSESTPDATTAPGHGTHRSRPPTPGLGSVRACLRQPNLDSELGLHAARCAAPGDWPGRFVVRSRKGPQRLPAAELGAELPAAGHQITQTVHFVCLSQLRHLNRMRFTARMGCMRVLKKLRRLRSMNRMIRIAGTEESAGFLRPRPRRSFEPGVGIDLPRSRQDRQEGPQQPRRQRSGCRTSNLSYPPSRSLWEALAPFLLRPSGWVADYGCVTTQTY
jgi:hypothetical protein